MDARMVGRGAAKLLAALQRAYRNNVGHLKHILVAAGVLYALPPLTQYWLSHVRIPEVPITAILALVAGALFIGSVAGLAYVSLHFIRLIPQVERQIVINNGSSTVRSGVKDYTPSEGTFIPTTDTGAWVEEQLADLKRKGVLLQTDVSDIEQLAKELAGSAGKRMDRRNGS